MTNQHRFPGPNEYLYCPDARVEGIPSKDLVGKSDGFRRPGYIASVEPSVFYYRGNHIFGLNWPIAVVRDRTQSQIDKKRQIETGQPVHGDAAFADYLISVSYAFRLAKKTANPFGIGQAAEQK